MRSVLRHSTAFVLLACSSPNDLPGGRSTGVAEGDMSGTPTDAMGTTPGGGGDPSTGAAPQGTLPAGGDGQVNPELQTTPGTGAATPANTTPASTQSDVGGVSTLPSAPAAEPVATDPPGTGGGSPVVGQGGVPPTPTGMGGSPLGMGGASTAGQPSGGMPSGMGGSPEPAGLGCTGNELLCEDFEGVAEGEIPGGIWQPLGESCEFQTASFTMGVTGEMANDGTQSLKVTNKHFAECRLSGGFDPVDEFWVRAYMYWETGLDLSNRETLAIDLTPGYRTADDPAVRFGYRSKSPCEEYAGPQITIIGLGGGEATGCGSRPMPQGEWFCFEAHVTQSSALDVNTFINSEAISYQSTGKEMTASIASESALAEKIDHIRLGIFSTGEAQGSVYIDDVAVATTRLGCGN